MSRALAVLVLVVCVVAWGHGSDEFKVPDDLATFRTWASLTREPRLVPHELSTLCVAAPPTLENLKKYGPHSNRWIAVYANPIARRAIHDASVKVFPPGAIIAKEKLRNPGGTETDGVAFMVKHDGSGFAESGGWEFLYYPSTATKPHYDTCISCHKAGGRKDYVFAGSAGRVRK